MSNNANKVLTLALANVKKTDGDKAAEKVQREVKENENHWRNELFRAEQAKDAASDKVEFLKSCTTATAAECLEAQRALALAEKNLTDMQALAEARF